MFACVYACVVTILCPNENLFVLSDPSKYFYNFLSTLMSPKKNALTHVCHTHYNTNTDSKMPQYRSENMLGPGNDLKIFISPQETQQKQKKKEPK